MSNLIRFRIQKQKEAFQNKQLKKGSGSTPKKSSPEKVAKVEEVDEEDDEEPPF